MSDKNCTEIRFVWVDTLCYGRQVGYIERIVETPYHGQTGLTAYIVAIPGNPFWTSYEPVETLEPVRAQPAPHEGIDIEAIEESSAYSLYLDQITAGEMAWEAE